MIKKIILAVALLIPGFAASAQSLKVGIVDTDAIVQVMPETADAQKKLADTSKKYEDQYAKLGEEMKRLYDEFQKLDESATNVERERAAQQIQEMQQKLQTFEQQAQQDLQRTQMELMSPIFQKIKTAVEAVGKEGNFSLIENYTAQLTLYYADPVVDITPQVKAKLGIK